MTTTKYHIRWMIRRDLIEVMAIENACYKNPWSQEELMQHLRSRNEIGMVAEHDERVVGFMVYALHKTELELLNFAVHPTFQRHGVGTSMADKLKSKLSAHRRSSIWVNVSETNMDALMFFKASEFWATGLVRDFYDESDEDAISFVYQFQGEL